MRIIRLTSSEGSLFENDFSDEIPIEPNGQLALLNTSLKMVSKEIIIDAGNDLIKYQLTAGEGQRDVRLNHQPYKQPNTQLFLDDITLALNNSVGYLLDDANYDPPNSKIGGVPLEVGMQWKCSQVSKSNKITIEYKNAKRQMRTADYTKVNVAAGANGANISKHSKGADTTKNGYLFSAIAVSEGQCQFLLQADKLVKATTGAADDGEVGVIMGFSTKDFSKGGTPTVADVKYGVHLLHGHSDTLPFVATVEDGVADYTTARASIVADNSDSPHYYDYVGASSAGNTVFGMGINLGALQFVTYTKVGAATEERIISSVDLKNPTTATTRKLYPVIIYLSDATTGLLGQLVLGNNSANNSFVTLNPYELNLPLTTTTGASQSDLLAADPSPPAQVFRSSRNNLTLPSSVAEYLGYSTAHQPRPEDASQPLEDPLTVFNTVKTTPAVGAVPGFNYTFLQYNADNTFKAATLNDNFVIEVLSQNLDSYDGQTTERRSILATIPSAEDANGNLIYEANILNKVSIRNSSTVGMRNMRCRVLTSDLSPVEMNGKSVITIGLYDTAKP